MSNAVKLSTKLGADPELNGVDALAADLIERPKVLRAAIIWFDVAKETLDVDKGDRVPTIRVRRIEPLGDVDDVPTAVTKAVGESMQKRTGRAALPFGIVEVSEEAYGDTLPEDE